MVENIVLVNLHNNKGLTEFNHFTRQFIDFTREFPAFTRQFIDFTREFPLSIGKISACSTMKRSLYKTSKNCR